MNVRVRIDIKHLRQRIWGMIPGLLSWGTLVSLTVLAFILPFWIAVFIIAYDVYILIRIAYMSVHLLYAYRKLKEYKGIDWIKKCQNASTDMHWNDVQHLVVIPTYNESLPILRSTLDALISTDFPKDQVHIVVGFEERAGQKARKKAQALEAEYAHHVKTFITTFHPDGLPGERRVKSANATWAVRQMEKKLIDLGITEDQIVVSNLDSDTVVPPQYFAYLTYAFITHPDRYRVSYQPIPVYNNNLWDAPAFSRVIAMNSTFWQMIESTRPERMVTFSSHAMTLKALRKVGYWDTSVISEDSRIFWQCLLAHDGQYSTEPLYMTVSMDAALAPTWWRTLKNQYKQKQRWAWGIENFPYMVEGFIENKSIPFTKKCRYLFRTIEGHYSWATAAIIIAVVGWLPVFFGGPEFHATFLSYSLPFVTRTIMTVAMSGLIISAMLTLLLMPPRPKQYGIARYVFMILQWILVPITATVLSAFPALDAETRLLLGRDLHFNVMQKARRGVDT